jgi:hypothetical protein
MRHTSHHRGADYSAPKFKSRESPGLDGLTYELYQKFWNELSPLLLQVANTSLQEGKLATSMLNGIITLIPKKGDHTLLSNWRPITLLNTDYKLITRCLAGRIISVLQKTSYVIPTQLFHWRLLLPSNNIHNSIVACLYSVARCLPARCLATLCCVIQRWADMSQYLYLLQNSLYSLILVFF